MARKPWGVLAYIVSDHNATGPSIDRYAERELTQLQKAAVQTQMDLAVQIDLNRRAATTRIEFEPIRRAKSIGYALPVFRRVNPRKHEITRKVLDSGALVKASVEEAAEADAASPHVLRQFVKWGRSQCDADRYVIMFWGHSSGPGGLFFDNKPGRTTAKMLDPAELAKAIEPTDVVLFRDCFMSTLEVAYQLNGVARFAIASQALDPIRSPWPHADLFGILQTATSRNEERVARALALRLGTFYDDARNRYGIADVPYTLLDIDKIDGMTRPLQMLVDALEDSRTGSKELSLARGALEDARRGSFRSYLRPGDRALIDVPALCANLKRTNIPSLANAATAVEEAWLPVRRYHHTQADRYNGISAYYKPSTKFALKHSCVEPVTPTRYNALALSAKTRWNTIALRPLGEPAHVKK
jgi:hypothetical protein